MQSNIIGIYEDLNATARAKSEAIAAQGVFVSGVMEQGYRLWLTLLSTEVNEAMRVAQEMSACKTPAEIIEIQALWLQATSARAITSLQGTIEIANFLISNLQTNVTAIATPPAVSTTPTVLPAPPIALPSPTVPAPVAVVASVAPVSATPAVPIVTEAAVAPAPTAPAPAAPAPAAPVVTPKVSGKAHKRTPG